MYVMMGSSKPPTLGSRKLATAGVGIGIDCTKEISTGTYIPSVHGASVQATCLDERYNTP